MKPLTREEIEARMVAIALSLDTDVPREMFGKPSPPIESQAVALIRLVAELQLKIERLEAERQVPREVAGEEAACDLASALTAPYYGLMQHPDESDDGFRARLAGEVERLEARSQEKPKR